MKAKFTGAEFMDAVTAVLLEMNGKFQNKTHVSNKDLVTVGYVAMAIQRLEKVEITSPDTTTLEEVYDDTNPESVRQSLEEI